MLRCSLHVFSLSGMSRDIRCLDQTSVRPINFDDFLLGLKQVRASVSSKELGGYLEWNKQYGSLPAQESTVGGVGKALNVKWCLLVGEY